MKGAIITGALFLVLCLAVGWFWSEYRKEKANAERLQQNWEYSQREVSEVVQNYSITKAELRRNEALKDSLIALGYKPARVKEIHSIQWKIKHDTVFIAESTTENDSLKWTYDIGCLTVNTNYVASQGALTQTVEGVIDVNVITALYPPKNWFWKLKWNPEKWPDSTKVETSCGELEVKKNVKFNIK